MALEMRLACERCAAPLDPSGAAFICSYECTWCPTCADAMRGRWLTGGRARPATANG